ncbi:Glycosylphosphatidylinositol-mannosyltransferase I, PIG-X/PBN1 [Phaffia rhodozyma]|uniref:Protein PBN1 n=1 Tax=Phaffia rhodozyma TaxID=264483 RepID=A0A0F7SUM6_PHARH|nr:Glycosylphosphatidylinositol-mannosyltransferase I, PIG-X/PBN1 [Phaffia rhodozyma]
MSLPIHRPHGQLEREGGARGGLGSSPIVADLTASPDGEGLTREELESERLERQRSARKNRFPIHQFRQSLPLDLNSDVPPPFDLPVYTSALLPEQSFHSTLLTTFSLPTVHSNADIPQSFLECTVLLIYHVPPSVIIDPYQIDQLHTDGVLGDSVQFFGDIELELPLSRLSDRARDGSGLILEINLIQQKEKIAEGNKERNIQVGVPLHGRYLEPKRVEEERSERTVDIEWPWVGLKCPLSPSSSSAGSFFLFTSPLVLLSIMALSSTGNT